MPKAIISGFNLRVALICNVIIPLLLAMGLATYLGLKALENSIENHMQEEVELVARAIRMPVSYSLEKDRFGSVNQALQSVFRIDRVYGAYVYDAQGRRISAVGAAAPSSQHGEAREITTEGERKGQYEEIEGQSVYSYFVPLFDTAGTPNGLLQVSRKKSDIEQYIATMRMQAIYSLGGAGLFIAAMVLIGFHGTIGKYLDRLVASMEKVASGERTHRASLRGPREISVLARALNSMLDSISRAEDEIARRKDAQQDLENKLRQSEKMAAIGQLAAGVAHELGAPLSVIHGKAQRCLRDKDLPQIHQKSMLDIRNEVQRMEHIVRQLLDFGRASRQRRRWRSTASLARAAASQVQKEMPVQAELELQGPDPGPNIYVDQLRIEQALINLLRNSLQAPGVSRVILGWSQAENGQVAFWVEDNGPGIPESDKDKIFEPFFSTKKEGQGTGLGLSVVHGIVQEHFGQVQVQKSFLGGACIGFNLALQSEKPLLDKEHTEDAANDAS
ncbi:MAG: sensor histidine kinase [Thermodesulfobacteriota bacterium]